MPLLHLPAVVKNYSRPACDRIVFKMAEGPQQPLPKRHDLQTSADLERVTDYAEEKEISTTDIENVSIVHF